MAATSAWDFVRPIQDKLHKDSLIKYGYKEIFDKRHDIWPGLQQQTYIDRLMKTYKTDSGVFLPDTTVKVSPGVRTEGKKSLNTVEPMSSSETAFPESLNVKFLTHLKYPTINLDLVRNIVSTGQELRPMTCFVTNFVYMYPSIFLSNMMNVWTNTRLDVDKGPIPSDYLKDFLGFGQGSPYIYNRVAQYATLFNNLISHYFVDNYLKSVLKNDNDFNSEWNRARYITKLLIIAVGPQGR